MSKDVLAGECPRPRYLTVREAARALGMSRQTLWRRIRLGTVQPLTVDGRYVIPTHRLDALKTDQRIAARPYRRQGQHRGDAAQ